MLDKINEGQQHPIITFKELVTPKTPAQVYQIVDEIFGNIHKDPWRDFVIKQIDQSVPLPLTTDQLAKLPTPPDFCHNSDVKHPPAAAIDKSALALNLRDAEDFENLDDDGKALLQKQRSVSLVSLHLFIAITAPPWSVADSRMLLPNSSSPSRGSFNI